MPTVRSAAPVGSDIQFILEKAVNHDGHNEHALKATGPWAQIPLRYNVKTMTYVFFMDHPMGDP